MAEWAADDCALLLWTTDPLLPTALEVIRAWGFTYKTVGFYWAKLNKSADPTVYHEASFLPASAFGPAPILSSACWRPAATPIAAGPTCAS